MKIIDEPSKKPWELESTCLRCETRVVITIEDFQRTVSAQRDGDAAIYVCPTCGIDHWVDIELIPRAQRHKLPK